jgi:hypothetical protein
MTHLTYTRTIRVGGRDHEFLSRSPASLGLEQVDLDDSGIFGYYRQCYSLVPARFGLLKSQRPAEVTNA